MLVLSRRVNETLCIGDDITIVVSKVQGSLVSMVINAPNVKITHRNQVYKSDHEIPLTLNKAIKDSFSLGSDISIHVIGTQGAQVRVGIDAPRDIEVHREEIYQRIKKCG